MTRRVLTNVDRLLGAIDPEEAQAFEVWAKWQPFEAIRLRLEEIRRDYATRGIELVQCKKDNIRAWYHRLYPMGAQGMHVLVDVRQYEGVREDALSFAEQAIAITSENLECVQAKLRQTPGWRRRKKKRAPEDEGAPEDIGDISTAMLYQAGQLAKELRTGAIALHEAKLAQDEQKVGFTYAYRLAEVIATVCKGQPHEGAMRAALEAGIQQLEQEAR